MSTNRTPNNPINIDYHAIMQLYSELYADFIQVIMCWYGVERCIYGLDKSEAGHPPPPPLRVCMICIPISLLASKTRPCKGVKNVN